MSEEILHTDPSYIATRKLAAVIILTAMEDLKQLKRRGEFMVPKRDNGYLVTRKELRTFFDSEWFKQLLHILELDYTKVRPQITIPANKPYWKEVRDKRKKKWQPRQ